MTGTERKGLYNIGCKKKLIHPSNTGLGTFLNKGHTVY